MSIERNFTGFEFADGSELRYGTGSFSGSLNSIPSGTARSGSYHLRLASATNAANLLSFPVGTVVGTSGTVTSGNHKRVSVRAYFRIEAQANNGQIRIFGFGNDSGSCTVQFGAQNSSGGFLQSGTKIGLRIGAQSHNSGAVGAYPWGSVDLSTGVWYRLLLDIDLDVQATTTVNATLRITEDSSSPTIDFTLTNSVNIGATDNLDALALGYSNGSIGAFARTATVNWDDIVYIGTSNADAVSGQPTLPSETHIYAIVPPTGHALRSAGWTGTYADVDEYPVSGADTMSSSTAGDEVEFSHSSGIRLGYSAIYAMKMYCNAEISGAGTGSVDYMLNGVAKNVTLGVNFPANIAVDPVGGVLFQTFTPYAFGATTFGLKKQNGTQLTIIGNIGLEIIATLATYGSGNQIRGETQIKAGSIYDAQVADAAGIQRHKIQGLSDGPTPIFFPEDAPHEELMMIPGPAGSAAAVRIPPVPVFFPDDQEDPMLMAASSGSSSGGGTTTNNNYYNYGGPVLIASLTAAGSASLDFATRNATGQTGALFQSDFDQYIIEIVALVPATDNVDLLMRCSTDGGATYDSGANYGRQIRADNASFNQVAGADSGLTSISLAANLDTTTAQGSLSATVKCFAPLNTSLYKVFTLQGSYHNNDTHYYSFLGEGRYLSASAVNALRFILSSGNITSGDVRIYGIPKTPSLPIVSSGGITLLYQNAFSGVANVDIVSRNVGSMAGGIFQSDFDEYIIELVNVAVGTNDAGLLGRVSTDGGSTFSTTTYARTFQYGAANNTTSGGGATAQSQWDISGNQSNAATAALCGFFKLYAPQSAAFYKQMIGCVAWGHTGVDWISTEYSLIWKTTTAINALRFLASSGNISGAIRVYGVDKTGMSAGSTVVAGALSISADAAPGSPINLTTTGTYDWGAPTNNTTPLSLQQAPYPNRKLVSRSFVEHAWVAAGLSLTFFTGALATATVSCTAADNQAQSALSAFGTGALAFSGSAGVTGYGFVLRVKAGQASRTMKICARMWSGIYTLVAKLSDGSAADVTATYDTGAGAGTEREWTITYNAATENQVLTILFTLTTNRGSSPHVGLIYFTVG